MVKNKHLSLVALIWSSGAWAGGCASRPAPVRPVDQPMAAISVRVVQFVPTSAGPAYLGGRRGTIVRQRPHLSVEERVMIETFGGTPYRNED